MSGPNVHEVGPNDRLIIVGLHVDDDLLDALPTSGLLLISEDVSDVFIVRNGLTPQEDGRNG